MAVKTYKKAIGESNFTLLSQHADGVNSEVAGTLTPGTTYNFKLVPVVNGVDDEGNALYDSATTFSGDTDFLSVTTSETSQTVMWSALDGATGYELERATSSDYSGAVNVYTGPNTFYEDLGQIPGTIYYYRVRSTPSGNWITYSRPAPYLYEMFEGIQGGVLGNGWNIVSGNFTYDSHQLRAGTGAAPQGIIYKDVGATDYVINTYMQGNTGMGVLFRYVDENNFLMFRVHTGTSPGSVALQLYERVAGTFTLLKSSVQSFVTGRIEPFELKISVMGNQIDAMVQHYNYSLSHSTTRFQTATKIGIRSSYNTTVSTYVQDICGYLVAYPIPVEETQFKLYGVLEYFQEPVAVRYVGRFDRTYECYVSRWGEIVIRWYDHNGQVYGPLYVVDDLFPEHGIEAMDDHNPPSLHILPNGKIMIFYTVHDVNKIFYQKITSESENISTYGARKDMTDADNVPYNYPCPLQLSDYSLVIFYRVGSWDNSKWVYKRSTDQGETWVNPVAVAENTPNGLYSYVSQNPDNLDEIHMAGYFSYATSPFRTDIWYAKCPDILNSDTWVKSTGTPYTLPLTDSNRELVLEAGSLNNLVTDIKVIGNKPFITYGYDQNPNHKLRWCELSGGTWIHREVTPSTQFYVGDGKHQYTPGIILNPSNPYEVVLFVDRMSSAAGANRLEVEVWQSADQGATWAMTEQITQNSMYDNYRAQWVVNALPGHRFIWCGAGKFTGIDGNTQEGTAGNWWGFNNVRVQSEKDKVS